MSLETSILKTVAFFDIFEYPLTDFEIWQYLDQKCSYAEITRLLGSAALPLERTNAFWHLPDRGDIVATRQQRYIVADAKIKKAKRRLRLIEWLPGIRFIGLGNNIGTHNLRAGGDVDLFVITAAGRLWLVKLIATFILKLTGLRPTEHRSADRLCLSFLVDETALDLAPHRLEEDLYFSYWLAGLIPLYGDKAIYEKFLTQNGWIKEALPNRELIGSLPFKRFTVRGFSQKQFRFMKKINTIAQRLHWKLMSPQIKALANRDQRVIVTPNVLKLHTVDRRQYFRTEYEKRLAALPLSVDSHI